jgi:hypothetical protein
VGRLARDSRLLRRAERLLPVVAGAVLLAGILVYAFGRGGQARPSATVPLDPRAAVVAREFIRDAVQRRDLDHAYRLVTPGLRRGYSLARWRTGSIPIVPFPGKDLRIAPFAVKLSVRSRAVLSTELESDSTRATPFRIGLVERGGRWLVDTWTPARARRPDA